jgi:L-lysine 2,3-aminomutase
VVFDFLQAMLVIIEHGRVMRVDFSDKLHERLDPFGNDAEMSACVLTLRYDPGVELLPEFQCGESRRLCTQNLRPHLHGNGVSFFRHSAGCAALLQAA